MTTPDRRLAADRAGLPASVLAAMTLATSCSVALATQTIPASGAFPASSAAGGFLSGALAVLALRSVSIRATARTMCAVGLFMLLRYGQSPLDAAGGSATLIAWVFATTTTLVLASSVSRWLVRTPRTGRPHRPFRGVVRAAAVVSCVAAAVAMTWSPTLAAGFGGDGADGDLPKPDPGATDSAMMASPTLDMTKRPRLSDNLVMTVATDRPGFWRSQTFDLWSGARWSRSDAEQLDVPESGRLSTDSFDLAARSGRTVTQQFRIEASLASALPMLPAATEIRSSVRLLQTRYGDVLTSRSVGRGMTYSVRSSVMDVDEASLRASASGTVPPDLAARYAADPVATDRVRQLAASLRGPTAFDTVANIVAWLGDHTKYSIDAPLSPTGADVVDDFLFRSKVGWCEQIASSLTVLLRLDGVPARLATGYVPDSRDPITGRYRVLERDAHAWTEVWFPGAGWVPFDPTADVPLSGPVPDRTSGLAALVQQWGVTVLVAAAVIAAFGPPAVGWILAGGGALARRWGSRRRRARRGGDWPATVDDRLAAIGARCGRARAPSDTSTHFGAVLAATIDDERVAFAGSAADRERYGPPEAPADRDAARAEADRFLEELLGGELSAPATR
ncbi:MAG: transglutaminaseTgpA domain-containing protein [Acidimicrobiales bacterium]